MPIDTVKVPIKHVESTNKTFEIPNNNVKVTIRHVEIPLNHVESPNKTFEGTIKIKDNKKVLF